MGVHKLESEHVLRARISSDKPSICGFFATRDAACTMFFSKYAEISERYKSIACYELDIKQSPADVVAGVSVEAMPIVKLYKDGLEKGEAITTKELHGLFEKAESLG